MRQINRSFIVFTLILFALGCAHKSATSPNTMSATSSKPELSGEILRFAEILPNQPETAVRMIITDQYVRVDEGRQSEDFMLFDRRTKDFYNIIAEDKTISLFKYQPRELKSPFPILWNVESQTSHLLMRNNNENSASATHYRLLLNQKECYNVVALDKGLEKSIQAMRELRQAMADNLKNNYRPANNQSCYEAVNIFTPVESLYQGFPIREWSEYGYQRFLVDHKKKIIFPAKLFKLPENYSIFNM